MLLCIIFVLKRILNLTVIVFIFVIHNIISIEIISHIVLNDLEFNVYNVYSILFSRLLKSVLVYFTRFSSNLSHSSNEIVRNRDNVFCRYLNSFNITSCSDHNETFDNHNLIKCQRNNHFIINLSIM